MANVFGSEFRRVDNREHLGKPAIVAVAIRTYDTSVDDLWEALTTRERLARWFGKVGGDLELGGRYQIEGNASGTWTREMMGATDCCSSFTMGASVPSTTIRLIMFSS